MGQFFGEKNFILYQQPSQNVFGEQITRKVETVLVLKAPKLVSKGRKLFGGMGACSPWEFFKFRHSQMGDLVTKFHIMELTLAWSLIRNTGMLVN